MPDRSTGGKQSLRVLDLEPRPADFLGEACAGLALPQKELSPKFLYDERGSRLFERITTLEEYYPTRVEMGILADNGAAIADRIGSEVRLVELGSGASVKTRALLDHLDRAVAYVPVDISREHLLKSAEELQAQYPTVEVLPVCADYTEPFPLPRPWRPAAHTAAFFPGSTIGNFEPADATRFLSRIRGLVEPGGSLVIGVDLKKDRATLERAYDDSEGVTREFILNLLVRMNNELGADFQIESYRYEARWNDGEGRVEMHIESVIDQTVKLGGRAFEFEAGESILAESSYKYELDEFAELAGAAGFDVEQVWTDSEVRFSVQNLTVRR